MPERVLFLVDGFNLYHSVCQALADRRVTNAKWLDFNSFCRSLLVDVISFQPKADLARVSYFTALAHHVPDPGVVQRHRTFIAALESVGVDAVLGNFKQKQVKCRATCQQRFQTHKKKRPTSILQFLC